MKEVARNCLQITSLKGVPRIVNSKTYGLKILWLVAVTILIFFSIYQTVMLLLIYFEYPTATTVDIETNSVHFGKEPFHLQVCNLNIFAFRSQIGQQSIMDYLSDYKTHVENMSKCRDCTIQEKSIVNQWESEYLSSNMLFQYMGPDLATQSPRNIEDFLIECRLVIFSGVSYKYVSCMNETKINITPDPDHLSCLTIQLPVSYPKKFYIGVILTFYLDTWPDDIYIPYNADNFFTGNSRGLFYQVFEPHTAPMDLINFREVAPGFVSNTMIEYSWMHRLNMPHGQCKDANKIYMIYGTQEVKETLRLCYALCQIHKVQASCNCTTLNHFSPENTTFPFCNSPRHSARIRLAYNKCEAQVQQRSNGECMDCAVACTEMSLASRTSQSKWLLPLQFHSFYDKVLKDKSYAHKFDKYLLLLNEFYKQNSSIDNRNVTSTGSDLRSQLLYEEKLVHENFAKIKVMLGSSSQLHYRQKYQMEFANLMGQLGGILNLYSGISVILVVELVDFLVRICQSKKRVDPK